MAAHGKKRAVESEMQFLEQQHSDDNDSSDEGDEEEENEMDADQEFINEEIQVEFEARNPEDPDYHGIVKLLQQLFLKANIDTGGLADTILSQNYIGSVMKQADIPEDDGSEEDDDMDVFGLTTAINITEKKDLASVKQLKSVLIDRCKECGSMEAQETFQSHLADDSNHIGLLFNERFINIPPQIALPAFESLWKEIDRAVSKKMKYKFSHYLLISKTYRIPMSKLKQKKKKQQQKLQEPAEVLTFVNPEERLFYEESSLHFEYCVKAERDTAVGGLWDDEEDEMEPYRTVILVPCDKIPVIMAKMRDMLEVQS